MEENINETANRYSQKAKDGEKMSFMNSWIIPTIVMMFIITFIGLACFGIYKFMRKFLPKELNSWFKFKILRKDWPEEDVAWCVDCWEQGSSSIDVAKFLKIEGVDDVRFEDTLYIFKEITKLKGGQKFDGRQIKASSLKTFPRRSEETQKRG